MQRFWKPLDVGGLRLYEVIASRPSPLLPGKIWNKHMIVAADSPSNAAGIVKGCGYDGEWTVQGRPLSILMPAAWWNECPPFLSLVYANTKTPLQDPHTCKHEHKLLLHSSRGTGNDVRWDNTAWLCQYCGEFEIRTSRNGERSTVTFHLLTDQQIRAAVRCAQYLSSHHIQSETAPSSEISNYEI